MLPELHFGRDRDRSGVQQQSDLDAPEDEHTFSTSTSPVASDHRNPGTAPHA
jgi:hypothetical protein